MGGATRPSSVRISSADADSILQKIFNCEPIQRTNNTDGPSEDCW